MMMATCLGITVLWGTASVELEKSDFTMPTPR